MSEQLRPISSDMNTPHCWPEDYPHENGKYINRCIDCGTDFWGHKRRMVCKVCAEKPTPDPTKRERERAVENARDIAANEAFWPPMTVGIARALLEAEERIAKQRERIEALERLDREAATHVESVICLRTDFTGEPPYVGWKGLGLALSEALHARDEANREVINLMRDKSVAESQSATLSQRVAELEGELATAATAIEMVIRNRPQSEGAPTNIALDVIAKRASATLSNTHNTGEKNVP